jgi:hypothetical protein
MATEKGYNELFSVARKVIILLISFKSPQSRENRAAAHPNYPSTEYTGRHTVSPPNPQMMAG